jgi:hypothetical protein
MVTKLSPFPVGINPGSSYWSDLYERIRFLVNQQLESISWDILTGTPTTLAGYGITDPVELTTNKDAASGYAGLSSQSRITKGVKTTDDVIIDLATKGLVLKDTQGTPHYWRVTISTVGALVTTDLGTTAP